MNDINSAENYKLSFFFDIPEELCQYYEEDYLDVQCAPGVDYDLALSNKWIVILNN